MGRCRSRAPVGGAAAADLATLSAGGKGARRRGEGATPPRRRPYGLRRWCRGEQHVPAKQEKA
uniref:Uncharacterized protein n=1 Tax=Oryza glumipatula TaxID=40148 RepID=A0A0E0AYY9_9ORYZ